MNSQKVKLAKLSVCACGFTLLKDSIALGTEYTIYPTTKRRGYSIGCGGCGTINGPFIVVDANQITRPDLAPEPLPAEIFEEA